jgi:hypothetical protein
MGLVENDRAVLFPIRRLFAASPYLVVIDKGNTAAQDIAVEIVEKLDISLPRAEGRLRSYD